MSDLGGEEFLKYSRDNKNKISNYTNKEIEQNYQKEEIINAKFIGTIH